MRGEQSLHGNECGASNSVSYWRFEGALSRLVGRPDQARAS